MSNTKITYYSIDRIRSLDADINIIWGERSNGKSYAVKHEIAMKTYLESIVKDSLNRERFILMRRLREEVTSEKIERYFADVDVRKLTENKYNTIVYYRKQVFLANYDIETGKTVRGDCIGYVVALSTEQHYAGGSYLDVKNIIFEEFMSRSVYLANEPDKLMNFFNTVDRKRRAVKLWLIGNTISRVCPYLVDWDLLKIISTQKQGTIITKYIDTGTYTDEGEPIRVKIAVEYCKSTGRSSYSIGKHKDMLNKGSWQSDPQPHLPKSYNDYKKVYRLGFEFKEFRFLGELLLDKDTKDMIWFIYPYSKEFKKDLLIISDIVKTDYHYQRNIYDVTIKSERLHTILDTFRESNIFYSSDLVGTDFKQAIDFSIRK